jgi:hypothetical protein
MMEIEEDPSMTELPLLQFCDAQVRLINRLVFDGETRDDAPGVHARIDRMIPELIAVCDSGREALEMMLNALIFHQIKKTYPIFLVVRELLPRTILLLERLRRHFREQSREGFPLDRLDDYEEAVNRFRKSVEQFLMKWPWFDPEEIKKSEDSDQRGEYREAREVLVELLHQGSEAR